MIIFYYTWLIAFISCFILGHKYIRPKSIHDTDTVDEYSKDFMYLACIKFINSVSIRFVREYYNSDEPSFVQSPISQVKTESLRWSSPMIDDISGVKFVTNVSCCFINSFFHSPSLYLSVHFSSINHSERGQR